MKLFIILGLLLAAATSLFSQTSTGPFTGIFSESFESISVPDHVIPVNSGKEVMGGFATLSNPSMYAINGVGVWWEGGPSAIPWDGLQFLVLNGVQKTLTITFDETVSRFGGYWLQSKDSPDVAISFYDIADELIGASAFYAFSETGNMTWNGWSLATEAKRVTVTGNFLAMDGLQADAVPEPTTWALLGLGAFVVLWQLRRRVA